MWSSAPRNNTGLRQVRGQERAVVRRVSQGVSGHGGGGCPEQPCFSGVAEVLEWYIGAPRDRYLSMVSEPWGTAQACRMSEFLDDYSISRVQVTNKVITITRTSFLAVMLSILSSRFCFCRIQRANTSTFSRAPLKYALPVVYETAALAL